MSRNKKTSKRRVGQNKRPKLTFSKRLYLSLWRFRNWFQRGFLVLIGAALLFVGANYVVSYWYLKKHQDEPLTYGVTFIPRYAEFFELDPKETMDALINDLGFKRFRLVSYWDDVEKVRGTYDYSELDWQFQKAEAAGVKVNLSLGLRQPRWPECHMPAWAAKQPKDVWYPELKQFIQSTVERYKDSPALISYQVENEFFMTIFGECIDFDRNRLVEEYNLVKSLDPDKPIIVTRSNNWGGVPLGEPTPDLFGVAVYKRVWDKTATKRYFEYPYPPWFYGALAGAGEIVSGKPMIIHELQMEPWLPDTGQYAMNSIASLKEQDKSLDAPRLKERFKYAEDTGIRTIDTWGAEWWYWRKVVANDPSLWEVAREAIHDANAKNRSN